jgi:hypothetical protein
LKNSGDVWLKVAAITSQDPERMLDALDPWQSLVTNTSAVLTYFNILQTTAVGCDRGFIYDPERDQYFLNLTNCNQNGSNLSANMGVSDVNVVASTCTLYFCVKDYRTRINGGNLEEEEIGVLPVPKVPLKREYPYNHPSVLPLPCIVNGRAYDASNVSLLQAAGYAMRNMSDEHGNFQILPEICMYDAEYSFYMGLTSSVEGLLSGTCNLGYDMNSVRCDSAWWLAPLYNSGNGTIESVNSTLNGLAKVITNRIRVLGLDATNQTALAKGIIVQTTTCTKFQWEWLLLPAILLAVTTFCLLYVVVRGVVGREKEPVWKSSVLPLLYAGPQLRSRRSGEGRSTSPDRIREMKKEAKSTAVKLTKNAEDGRWRLVEVRQHHGKTPPD